MSDIDFKITINCKLDKPSFKELNEFIKKLEKINKILLLNKLSRIR